MTLLIFCALSILLVEICCSTSKFHVNCMTKCCMCWQYWQCEDLGSDLIHGVSATGTRQLYFEPSVSRTKCGPALTRHHLPGAGRVVNIVTVLMYRHGLLWRSAGLGQHYSALHINIHGRRSHSSPCLTQCSVKITNKSCKYPSKVSYNWFLNPIQ